MYGRDDDELDLRVYLSLLRRRWLIIAVTVLVVVVIALALTFREESQYRATSEILIRQESSSALPEQSSPNVQLAERELNNEERLFESVTMRDQVDEVYDGPIALSRVKASTTSGTSDVLEASVTHPDPDEAVELLDLYVQTFIDYRRTQDLEDLLAVSQPLETQIQELTERINQARAPIAAIDAQLANDPENEGLLQQRADLEGQLSETIDPLVRQRAVFEAQLDQIDVTRQIAEIGGATVLSAARSSGSPVSPQPARNLAVAGVVGLILGVGLAFARDSLDTRIHSVAELEELTGGRPTLAVVPQHPNRKDHSYVATRDNPQGTHAEAYRSLRTSIRFASIEKSIKVIQLTSPSQGEGKSTTVANLAVAFAKAGERVLVICCDLRRPHIQDRFGFELAPGFTDVVVGGAQPAQVINRANGPELSILTAGSRPPNPSELLSSQRAKAVVEQAAASYDVVILDSTPVLPVTDAVVVSQLADATVVVVDAQTTDRDDVNETMRRLDQAHAPVLGTVLNGVRDGAGGYGYGYGYGYAEDAIPVSRRSKRRRRFRSRSRPPKPVEGTTAPEGGTGRTLPDTPSRRAGASERVQETTPPAQEAKPLEPEDAPPTQVTAPPVQEPRAPVQEPRAPEHEPRATEQESPWPLRATRPPGNGTSAPSHESTSGAGEQAAAGGE